MNKEKELEYYSKLTQNLSKIISKNLKKFMKINTYEEPMVLTPDEIIKGNWEEKNTKKWIEIQNKIINSFEILGRNDYKEIEEKEKEIEEGIKLFTEYFQCLQFDIIGDDDEKL